MTFGVEQSKSVIDCLGVDVVYIRSDSSRLPLKAIFDYAYSESFEASTRDPHFSFSDLDVKPERGDKIIYSNQVYQIVNIEPDGLGVSMCKVIKINYD